MIELREVTLRLGRERRVVLDAVSLLAGRGQCLVVLGPNGAGKTSMLRTMARLVYPSSGQVLIEGEDLRRHRSLLASVAFATEGDRSLVFAHTGTENLQIYLSRQGATAGNEEISAAAASLGLADRLDDVVNEYSKGMRQKLCLLGPMLLPANIILLDEPTVGVDLDSSESIVKNIRNLCESGKTVVVATHEFGFAKQIATHVAILSSGKLIAHSGIREFLEIGVLRRYNVTVRERIDLPEAIGADWLRYEFADATMFTSSATTDDSVKKLLSFLLQHDQAILEVTMDEPDFEQAYAEVLKRHGSLTSSIVDPRNGILTRT